MQEVADLAGVSRTTVSFVLNRTPNVNIPSETRERVLQAAYQLKYVPDAKAINLATGSTNMLGFVVRQTDRQLSVEAFLGEQLRGLSQALEPSGYHSLVIPVTPESDYAQIARSQKVDGLILTGPMLDDPEILALHEEGIPIVLRGTVDWDDLPSVDVDNARCAHLAVSHLTALGHRRIAHVTHAPLNIAAARQRLRGYREALEHAGILYDDTQVREGDFTDESGYTAAQPLLDQEWPPTAIFAGNDIVALGVLKAIRERGLRVPDDMSLVGFDDIPLISHLEPGLTTIHLPAFELGWHAGAMLLKLVNGIAVDEPNILLDTELIIRGSSGPPSAYS